MAKLKLLETKDLGQLSYSAAKSYIDNLCREIRPRNAASGEVMAVDSVRFSTDSQALKSLEDWGLPTPRRVLEVSTVSEIVERHARLAEERDRLPYEIDGVVIKLDDLGARDKLGSTAHHPRWAIAYKFAPRGEETRIEQIAIQVGRKGDDPWKM